ncbi:NAD-binding protein [Methanopyrus kandleri]
MCGFGRVGTQAAGRLRAHGFDVVVVDTSKERVERARREGVPHCRGEPHRPSDAGACGCGQGQVRGGFVQTRTRPTCT